MDDTQAQQWPYYPVFLRLQGRRVVVVGGGEVAARKLRLLRRAAPRLQIVARDLCEEVAAAVAAGDFEHLGEDFDPSQLDGCRLVVAATDDTQLNARVAEAASLRDIPVNVVDDPDISTYVTPSIVDRHPLLVAITTAGTAPVLGRQIREELETRLPSRLGELAAFMGRWRERIRDRVPMAARRGFWEQFLSGAAPERVLQGDIDAAEALLQRQIDGEVSRGEVYLVGAGPGDPDLLSFRALRLMQQCDVVLYDALIGDAILELVRRDAERIYVGKRRARHTLPQEQINAELIRLAREGKRVLRLKGGDPFVFGRGGEEIAELAGCGIPFQVVPGITAANGCAAYAGIPLTHRDHAQACVFVTGHARADGTLALNWDTLTRPGQTVVIYMGLTSLPAVCEALVSHGLDASHPAAVVEHGTRPQQRVVTATLGTLAQQVAEAGFSGPSLIIVGTVVLLRRQLAWYGVDPSGPD